MAKTYKALTKDNEVDNVKDVIVEVNEQTIDEKKDKLTLAEIDKRIEFIENKLTYYQAERVEVEKEAKKVVLKV